MGTPIEDLLRRSKGKVPASTQRPFLGAGDVTRAGQGVAPESIPAFDPGFEQAFGGGAGVTPAFGDVGAGPSAFDPFSILGEIPEAVSDAPLGAPRFGPFISAAAGREGDPTLGERGVEFGQVGGQIAAAPFRALGAGLEAAEEAVTVQDPFGEPEGTRVLPSPAESPFFRSRLAEQPSRRAQAFGETIEPLLSVTDELAGLAVTGFQDLLTDLNLAEEGDAARRARELREQGVNPIVAARRGFQETTDIPGLVKFLIQALVDPLNLIPGIGFVPKGGIRTFAEFVETVGRKNLDAAVPRLKAAVDEVLTSQRGGAAEDAIRGVTGGEVPEVTPAIPEERALAIRETDELDIPAPEQGRIKEQVIRDIQSGVASTDFRFHASNDVGGVVRGGLKAGGVSGSPIAEAGFGDVIHVFRASDLPPGDIPDISLVPGFDPTNAPKPIATFTREELGLPPSADLPRGARAQELGFEAEPPLEQLVSPEELSRIRQQEARQSSQIRDEIERAYSARSETGGVIPPPESFFKRGVGTFNEYDIRDLFSDDFIRGALRHNAEQGERIAKHPINMTAEEFDATLQRVAAFDRNLAEQEALFKKGGKEITEEQEGFLSGLSDPNEPFPQTVEELNEYRDAFSADLKSTPELFGVLGRNMHRVKPETVQAIQSGQRASLAEGVAAVTVLRAVETLTSRGISQSDIFANAAQFLAREVEPADAEFLLQDWLRVASQPPPPAASRAEDAIRSVTGGEVPEVTPAIPERRALAAREADELDIPAAPEREALPEDEGIISPENAVATGTPDVVERASVKQTEQSTRQGALETIMGQSDATLDEALDSGVKKVAADQGLPPPPKPPAIATVSGATSGDTGGSFARVLNVIPGEDPIRRAVAQWEGSRNIAAKETTLSWKDGQSLLRAAGLGVRVGGKQVVQKEDTVALFRALHGEIAPPPHLQDLFDDLKGLVAQEETDMLAFDPAFKKTLMANPDYFPRGWRDTRFAGRAGGKGAFGARPRHLKPRNDSTFSEMLDLGFEPISWNPYDMMALRRISGIDYREASQLMESMKKSGLVRKQADLVGDEIDKWSHPDIGPGFGGKPYIGSDGTIRHTPLLLVPNKWKGLIESIWGKPAKLEVNGTNIAPAINRTSGILKRNLLVASGFQHLDFFFRGGAVSATPTALRQGSAWKFAPLAVRLGQATILPSRRRALIDQILSDAPMFDDFPISLRDIANEGWQIGGDPSVVRRNAMEFLDDVVAGEAPGLSKRILKRIDGVREWWESGLFDGVYAETMIYGLEKFIVPKLRRAHPDWTPGQIAASAAEEVNIMFSALGEWQTVFATSPAFRDFGRNLIFSTNESESWIRAVISGLKGNNKRLWREYWIGLIMFMGITANGIQLASTGRPLSPSQYVPINTNDPFAMFSDEIPVIGGVSYNTSFLAPELPWKGRNGNKLYLDIIGQADTPIRWILNAPQAATSRLNVLPGAIMRQIQGETFTGEPVEGFKGKAGQFARETLIPIGPQNLLQAAKHIDTGDPRVSEGVFENLLEAIPPEEGRIGGTGGLIQASGINVRPEQSGELRDRMARESGLINESTGELVESWGALEPYQKDLVLARNPDFAREIATRQETSARRGSDFAKGQEQLDNITTERLQSEQSLDDRLGVSISPREFREEYTNIQSGAAKERSRVDKIFQLFTETGKISEDLNERALTEYYQAFTKSKTASGSLDFELLEAETSDLESRWTQAQSDYVDRNTGRTEHTPVVAEYLADMDTLQPYFEIERAIIGAQNDPQLLADYNTFRIGGSPGFRQAHPELDAVLSAVNEVQKAIRMGAVSFSAQSVAGISIPALNFTNEEADAIARALWKWEFRDGEATSISGVPLPDNPRIQIEAGELIIQNLQQGGGILDRRAINRQAVAP